MKKTPKRKPGGKRKGAGRKHLISPESPLKPKMMRATDEQWQRWKTAANASGKTISQWLRDVADAAAGVK